MHYFDVAVADSFFRDSFSKTCVTPVIKSCESKPSHVSFCASQRQGRLAANPAPVMTASPSIQPGCFCVVASNKLFACCNAEVSVGSLAERFSTRSAMAIKSSPANTLGLADVLV